jgi:hypothetical protein
MGDTKDKMTTDPTQGDEAIVRDPQAQQPQLTDDELKAQEGEELPDREQMSLINANVAAPINAAVALNALSDNSAAIANAEQQNDITQTN